MTVKGLKIGVLGLALVVVPGLAQAQLAPPPQKAPRTPVSRELLAGRATPMPATRNIEGAAKVLDSERLKVGDMEMRLYGVVPPQLGASFGPQARNVIDSLAVGSVSCQIKDRDREGRFLATCRNDSGADFGLELLRRGLAVTARGTLGSSELAAPYIAAEQAAQSQRIGMWSVAQPAALSDKTIREAAAKAEAEKQEAARAEAAAKAELMAKAEAVAAAAMKEADAQAAQTMASVAQVMGTTVKIEAPDAVLKNPPLPGAKPEAKPLTVGPTADQVQAFLNQSPTHQTAADDAPKAEVREEKNFIERYQILVTGILGLIAAFAVGGGIAWGRWQDRREETRSIAAALRGELMAARAICLARLTKIARESEEKTIAWPRLRTLVFQAYVGRLGRLGADLARQISSIYGQASDYASYYVGAESRPDVASKRQALQTLVQHIEEVMPRLSHIEREGKTPRPPAPPVQLSSWRGRMALPSSLTAKLAAIRSIGTPTPEGGPGGGHPAPLPALEEKIEVTPPPPRRVSLADAKEEIVSSPRFESTDEPVKASEETKKTAMPKKEKKAAEMAEREVETAQPKAEVEAEAETAEESGEEMPRLEEIVLHDPEAEEIEKIEVAEEAQAPVIAEAKEETKAEDITSEPIKAEAVIPDLSSRVIAEDRKIVRDESFVDMAEDRVIAAAAQPAKESAKAKPKPADILKAVETAVKPSLAEKEERARKALEEAARQAEAAKNAIQEKGINFAAPILQKLAKIKDIATTQIDKMRPRPMDDLIPDYANLTEEELEALAYSDDYLSHGSRGGGGNNSGRKTG